VGFFGRQQLTAQGKDAIMFVENWKQAWKWFSMQVYAIIFALPLVWMSLPEDVKHMVPDSWGRWIFVGLAVLGAFGRIVDQQSKKLPQ
jgi:hypothetical protein